MSMDEKSKPAVKRMLVVIFGIGAVVALVVYLWRDNSKEIPSSLIDPSSTSFKYYNAGDSVKSSDEYTPLEIENLKVVQKKLADSVVKLTNAANKGRKFVVAKLVALDSLVFEISEDAAQKNLAGSFGIDTASYRQWFENEMKKAVGDIYYAHPIYITWIVKKKQSDTDIDKPIEVGKIRQDKIARQFSTDNGAHLKLQDYIRHNMNDPASYEHIRTIFDDKGNYLFVVTTYKTKNAQGAKVVEKVGAGVDLDGNLVSIEKL